MDTTCFVTVSSVKQGKAISCKSIFSLIYYINYISNCLQQMKIDKLVIKNNIPLIWTIGLSGYKKDFYYHFHNVPRISVKRKKIKKMFWLFMRK